MDSSKNRIAKNVVFMYIRMFVLMLISLYTSRIILRELGVDDYGIYNLVGSIIAVFSSLRVLFTSAIQRFMNTEMGRGNYESLTKVFNMGVFVNVLLSVVFVLAVEILGIWFFENKINIPSERLFAAQCVFQLSLVSTVIGIMTTPYDAVIIANERMDFYAFSSIFDGILRLLIVFLLAYLPFDHLIAYALLLLAVQLLMRMIIAMYCRRNFTECYYKWCWDKQLFREMTSFAGWQFFGNTAFALTHNGLNMVLNIFGGAVVNAARGLATQVNTALGQFLSNIMIAVNPYCMKTYAQGNKEGAYMMLYFMTKILFAVQCLIVIPFFFLTEEVLELWLTEVPDYTVLFLRLILIWSLVRSVHSPIDTLFKASGEMKYYQLFEGITLSLPVIVSYIILSQGYPVYSVFVVTSIFEAINMMVILVVARARVGFSLKKYTHNAMLPCIPLLIVIALSSWSRFAVQMTTLSAVATTIATMAVLAVVFFWLCLAKGEREMLLSMVKEKIHKSNK